MPLSTPPEGAPGLYPRLAGHPRHRRTGCPTASLSVSALALALTILFPFLNLPAAVGIVLAACSVACGVAGLVFGIIGLAHPPATTGRPRAVMGIAFASTTLLLWAAGLLFVFVAIHNLRFTG